MLNSILLCNIFQKKGFEVKQNLKILKFVQSLGELRPEKSKAGEQQKILTSTFNIF